MLTPLSCAGSRPTPTPARSCTRCARWDVMRQAGPDSRDVCPWGVRDRAGVVADEGEVPLLCDRRSEARALTESFAFPGADGGRCGVESEERGDERRSDCSVEPVLRRRRHLHCIRPPALGTKRGNLPGVSKRDAIYGTLANTSAEPRASHGLWYEWDSSTDGLGTRAPGVSFRASGVGRE